MFVDAWPVLSSAFSTISKLIYKMSPIKQYNYKYTVELTETDIIVSLKLGQQSDLPVMKNYSNDLSI